MKSDASAGLASGARIIVTGIVAMLAPQKAARRASLRLRSSACISANTGLTNIESPNPQRKSSRAYPQAPLLARDFLRMEWNMLPGVRARRGGFLNAGGHRRAPGA